MRVSTKTQEAQAKALFAMQRRAALGLTGGVTAKHLAQLMGTLSKMQVAAALSLLAAKGLVQHESILDSGRWFLTTEGLNTEVK